jgi:catechol 2,3-dioxygenase-like lactoylglutathione lyase family enzyme
MSGALIGIDHAVVAVKDLDAAAGVWRRLGFTLAPKGVHSDFMGTANHCIMLGDDYVELIGVLKSTPANAHWRKLLQSHEGPAALAFATVDADLARGEIAGRGFEPAEPIEFSRPVDLPEGRREAAFRVVRTPLDTVPGMSVFVCHHKTRDAVWRPEWQRHANGALGIHRVVAVADDPKALAERLARFVGAEALNDGVGFAVDTGRQPIRVVAPKDLPGPATGARAPYLAGIAFRTGDIGAVLALLKREGIPHLAGAKSVIVPPAAATGAILEFVEI